MSITYPHADVPNAGAAFEIAPGVRWLRMPLPYALDHINLWLVADGDAWTAVDTGIALDTVKEAWTQVLADHRLCRQIVTHFHPDHLGLAGWLERQTGAPLWITLGEYSTGQLMRNQIAGYGIPAMLELFRSHGLDAASLEALVQRGNSYGRGVPEIPATFQRIRDGHAIAIGAHDWRVIAGYGHSSEHASLYCADLGVLISGDMLLPRISTNVSAFAAVPNVDALGMFLESIERFRALPADTLVLPSHGKPFRGMHARIDQLHAHHQARFELLLGACAKEPKSAADLMGVLFERAFTDAHQTMFALGEAIAHMIHLEQKCAVERVVDQGIIRFVKTH